VVVAVAVVVVIATVVVIDAVSKEQPALN